LFKLLSAFKTMFQYTCSVLKTYNKRNVNNRFSVHVGTWPKLFATTRKFFGLIVWQRRLYEN